ncbi:iron permease [Nordella sp. HKS 07]|uniref:FTR1 family iron permease n=1 Tax=Nordella sp. HKS 07 TaxID=2712222 RepID=UPI0013E1FEF5|nr:FTR1 family protein [Nordella sp. HKS 07]QIG49777.1 iron permease [Nordella sp. HKS 07]
MLAALIIVFREVVEAGLVVGIVLAATRSVGGSRLWTAFGVAGGVLGSCLVAIFAGAIANAFSGAGQELFNAAILSVAVVMLTWHNVWMASHGRDLANELRAAGEAVARGRKSLLALALVVGIAVLREGAEIVLFLYGVVITDGGSGIALLLGGFAGLALGVGLSAVTYLGLLRIPARHLFTSVMIAFLAAGLAAQATFFLEQAGLVEFLGDAVWDTSAILSEKSLLGRVLHTLIGYSDQPSLLQLLVYLGTLLAIYLLTRAFSPSQRTQMARSN